MTYVYTHKSQDFRYKTVLIQTTRQLTISPFTVLSADMTHQSGRLWECWPISPVTTYLSGDSSRPRPGDARGSWATRTTSHPPTWQPRAENWAQKRSSEIIDKNHFTLVLQHYRNSGVYGSGTSISERVQCGWKARRSMGHKSQRNGRRGNLS